MHQPFRAVGMPISATKSAHTYRFVVLFREFLEAHRAEYQSADPDDFATVGAMHRKFDQWLHALQHGESAEAESI